MTSLLNLDDAPEDAIERLLWLSGVRERALEELDLALADAYFTARLESRFPTALAAGPYAKKRALRLTRNENERRGRAVKWGDRLDSSSTSYRG